MGEKVQYNAVEYISEEDFLKETEGVKVAGGRQEESKTEEQDPDKPEVIVTIHGYPDGSLDVEGLHVNGQKLNNRTIETIVDRLAVEMRDARVAEMAIELFKRRLGGQ